MKKRFGKKLKYLSVLTLTCLALTGCDGDIGDFIDDINAPIENRIRQNQELLDKLQGCGLITQSYCNYLKQKMDEDSDIVKIMNLDGASAINKIQSSVVPYIVTCNTAFQEGGKTSYAENNVYQSMQQAQGLSWLNGEDRQDDTPYKDDIPRFANWIENQKAGGSGYVTIGEHGILDWFPNSTHARGTTGIPYESDNYVRGGLDKHDDIPALELLATSDQNMESNLNSILNGNIYVLNIDQVKAQAGTNGVIDLSDISAAARTIKELRNKMNPDPDASSTGLTAEEANTLNSARATLAKYFVRTEKTLNSNGMSIMRKTGVNKVAAAKMNSGILADGTFDFITTNDEVNRFNPTGYDVDGNLDLPADLAFLSSGCPVFTIRLHELNPAAITDIVSQCANMDDGFLVDDNNGAIAIYKMVYPVSYISGLEYDSSSGNVTATISDSDIVEVNIATGKYNNTEKSDLLTEEGFNALEQIYDVGGNSNNESSFILWKSETINETATPMVEVEGSLGEVTGAQPGQSTPIKEYKQSRILLRDYMEYTYLPDFIPNEKYAALGRRIRVNDLELTDNGSGDYVATVKDTTNFARFIDRTGRAIENTSQIQVRNVIDIHSGMGDYDRVAIRLSNSKPDGLQSIDPDTGQGVTTQTDINGTIIARSSDGSWDTSSGDKKWKKSDSTYASGCWLWIDDDGDNVAECYYLHSDGRLAVSETVGGYEVDADGKWVENGAVKTETISTGSGGLGGGNSGGTGFAVDETRGFSSQQYADSIRCTTTFPVENATMITDISGTRIERSSDGQWVEDNGKWWWKRTDGSWPAGMWLWIDDNDDGKAECYYFGSDGWMKSSTTQGGYKINSSGQWVDDAGEIQREIIESEGDGFTVANADAIRNRNPKESTLIMYGMCTDIDLFTSNLYLNWINVEGDGGNNGSLDWWNSWLESAGFIYRIDKAALADYLKMNFTANMYGKEDNIIVLNKETLQHISDDMKKEDRENSITAIRTIFVGLGFVAIVYAMLLLVAWVIDTGLSLESKYLGYLTGGRCVAVRDKMEIPSYVGDGTKYLTFSNVLTRVLIIMALALLLINTDFIALLVNGYKLFSGLTGEISRRIFNVR